MDVSCSFLRSSQCPWEQHATPIWFLPCIQTSLLHHDNELIIQLLNSSLLSRLSYSICCQHSSGKHKLGSWGRQRSPVSPEVVLQQPMGWPGMQVLSPGHLSPQQATQKPCPDIKMPLAGVRHHGLHSTCDRSSTSDLLAPPQTLQHQQSRSPKLLVQHRRTGITVLKELFQKLVLHLQNAAWSCCLALLQPVLASFCFLKGVMPLWTPTAADCTGTACYGCSNLIATATICMPVQAKCSASEQVKF